MGNVSITKLWEDSAESFGEIRLLAVGNRVTVNHDFYVSDQKLLQLSEDLTCFSKGGIPECLWSSGQDCSIHLFHRDSAGHIRAEITICLDEEDHHICRFYLDGLEAGPLALFAQSLPSLAIGETVSVF